MSFVPNCELNNDPPTSARELANEIENGFRELLRNCLECRHSLEMSLRTIQLLFSLFNTRYFGTREMPGRSFSLRSFEKRVLSIAVFIYMSANINPSNVRFLCMLCDDITCTLASERLKNTTPAVLLSNHSFAKRIRFA